MVPGSLGWATAVLAAMTMLAPSLAAFRAMALPMPRLPPVMKSVQPANFLKPGRQKEPAEHFAHANVTVVTNLTAESFSLKHNTELRLRLYSGFY